MNEWLTFLKQQVPEYDELAEFMEQGSVIKPMLSKSGSGWMIELEEVTPQSVNYRYSDLNNLDQRVDWATAELSKWDNCTRMAYSMWKFKKKHDAEKFITLYYLIWDR